jgi:hypothetical protein
VLHFVFNRAVFSSYFTPFDSVLQDLKTRSPFRLLDCASPGGDLGEIPDDDSGVPPPHTHTHRLNLFLDPGGMKNWENVHLSGLPTCCVVLTCMQIAYFLGQWPDLGTYSGKSSHYFPRNMDPSFLYPEIASKYTTTDDTTHDVACFVPGATPKILTSECPAPFISPIVDGHVESCIRMCPVQGAYTLEDYT